MTEKTKVLDLRFIVLPSGAMLMILCLIMMAMNFNDT